MNKFWDQAWKIRLVSLIFALFIYSFVRNESFDQRSLSLEGATTSVNSTEVYYNVPLYLGTHPDDIFVSELQEKVTVQLEGARNILNQVVGDSFIVETEPITESDIGKTTLDLFVKGLPPEISYEVLPNEVQVQVQKRQVVEKAIAVKIDDLKIAPEYHVVEVKVDPQSIQLVGNEQAIKSIDFAGIKISSNENDPEIKQSFKQTYRLQILDKVGNPLDIKADKTEINAEIVVEQNKKEVPLKIISIGEDNRRYLYSYYLLKDHQVTLFGRQDALDPIEQIEVVVDASNVKGTQVLKGLLNLPPEIAGANLNQVDVEVKVEPMAENAISNEEDEETEHSQDQ